MDCGWLSRKSRAARVSTCSLMIPQPGSEKTSPVDSTPVGAYTGGVGERIKERNDAKKARAAQDAEPAA